MLRVELPMATDSSEALPRRAVLAATAAACLLLAGCGAQFLYNRLDTVLYLYFSTQVSLQDTQARGLKLALREFLDWHRRSELPRYAQFAESLASDAGAPLSAQRIDTARRDIETLWRDSVARGAPQAARWLAGLEPAQRDELFASFSDNEADLRRELCETTEAEHRREREKDFIASVQDWVGALNAAQRALVRERLRALTASSCGWVANRARWLAELRRLVDANARDPDYVAHLTALLAHPEDRWDDAYRSGFEHNRDVVVRLLAELDATLDARQRTRLQARLRSYARDFRELAARPAVAG
jgi:hypothetical protein